MSKPMCTATRRDGSACRAPALPGGELCWSHDPRQAEAASAARVHGARKANTVRSLKAKRRRLDTHRGLAIFLNDVIHDVLEQKLDSDTARTVIYGCGLMQRLNEHGIEKRLAEVERLLAQRRIG